MRFSPKLLLLWLFFTFIFVITDVASGDEEYDDENEEDSLSRANRFHNPYEDRPCQYRRREGVCRRRSECRRPTRQTCRHGLNPIVCCLDRDARTTVTTTTTTTRRPQTRRPPSRNTVRPDAIKDIDLTFPGCGLRSPKVAEDTSRSSGGRLFGGNRRGRISSRLGKREVDYHQRLKRQLGWVAKPVIVGGREAVSNSWPWMVAVFRIPSSGGEKRFLCGASLISQRYVLTAAHCFDAEKRNIDPSKFVVVVGAHEPKKGTEYAVENILIHPDYQIRQYYNDLTLMRVRNTVELTKKVYPVCLPSDGLRNKIKVGSNNVTVIGWGDTTFGGISSKTLQEVTMPIVPLKECNASYSKIPLTNFPRGITNEFICAGYKEGGKDACQGDSGGPMTTELTDKAWVQLGVVSFGYGCARAGFPGVYTRMSHYTKWIYDNTDLGK